MFWHNKLEQTTDSNHQGYVPTRMDRELILRAVIKIWLRGSREDGEFYLGMSLIMFLNGLTWILISRIPMFLTGRNRVVTIRHHPYITMLH